MKWEVLELLSGPKTRRSLGDTWEKHFSGYLDFSAKGSPHKN